MGSTWYFQSSFPRTEGSGNPILSMRTITAPWCLRLYTLHSKKLTPSPIAFRAFASRKFYRLEGCPGRLFVYWLSVSSGEPSTSALHCTAPTTSQTSSTPGVSYCTARTVSTIVMCRESFPFTLECLITPQAWSERMHVSMFANAHFFFCRVPVSFCLAYERPWRLLSHPQSELGLCAMFSRLHSNARGTKYVYKYIYDSAYEGFHAGCCSSSIFASCFTDADADTAAISATTSADTTRGDPNGKAVEMYL